MATISDDLVEFSSCKFNLEIESVIPYDEEEVGVTFNAKLISKYGTLEEKIVCLEQDFSTMLEIFQRFIDTEEQTEIATMEPGFFMDAKRSQEIDDEVLYTVSFVLDAGLYGGDQSVTDSGPALYMRVKKRDFQAFKDDLVSELYSFK